MADADSVMTNVVRARQTSGGVTSGWSSALTARDHTQDFSDGSMRHFPMA
ncbi:hypothetical protein [Paraburkholderia sp. RAU2J]|nr:hypothetical protein [Paraburkholderia sp. RAU2J]